MDTYRKTIKADIEVLQKFGLDSHRIGAGKPEQISYTTRVFSVPEIKLLMDASWVLKFISKKKKRRVDRLKLGTLAGQHHAAILKNI